MVNLSFAQVRHYAIYIAKSKAFHEICVIKISDQIFLVTFYQNWRTSNTASGKKNNNTAKNKPCFKNL